MRCFSRSTRIVIQNNDNADTKENFDPIKHGLPIGQLEMRLPNQLRTYKNLDDDYATYRKSIIDRMTAIYNNEKNDKKIQEYEDKRAKKHQDSSD